VRGNVTPRAGLVALVLATGCGPGWLEVDEGPGLRGPGGPEVSFAEDQLFEGCAWLTGGEDDYDHHNLVMPYRGHLVMPWMPEWGSGGLTFFDVSDPCNPQKDGEGTWETTRETHAMAFLHLPEDAEFAGEYAVTNGLKGVVTWDVSDPADPHVVGELEVDEIFYLFDAYARVALSLAWQHPTLYIAAADNGLYVVDTTDPANMVVVEQVQLDPPIRAGGVFTLGNRLLLTSAEQEEAVVFDISDPHDPQPVLGGRFTTTDADGEPREHYHANLYGHTALFARKERGGGVLMMDLTDPSKPTRIGEAWTGEGGGGYVFGDEGFLFLGNSDFGVIFDARDPTDPVEVGRMAIEGDNDTLTPYGNIALLAVDGEANHEQSTAVVPWRTDPDTAAPLVLAVDPLDGAEDVALTARVGVGFNEIVEPGTVFMGSVRLSTERGRAVPGFVSAQEGIVTYVPHEPLDPGTTYVLEVLAGGVSDVNGNALEANFSSRFSTVGE